LTLQSVYLSSWHLPAFAWSTLFLIIPYVSFLQILIITHFSLFLFYSFFICGQTIYKLPF
jgi:hypothetical protein